MRKTTLVAVVVAILLAIPATLYASHQFADVPNTHTFHEAITWMADNGITQGCNPPANTNYCPENSVTRGQMAGFMKRFYDNLVAGGGTGGHLYPGIAVARELLRRQPDARVSFAGTAAGIEARVVPAEGFELDVIRSSGIKGKSIASRATGIVRVPCARMSIPRPSMTSRINIAGNSPWRTAIVVRSGTATFSEAATGPLPRASLPWQLAQKRSNSSAPL